MIRITGIYINNFKSFKDTYIPISDFNVVLGTNNAGKSNLMDVFKFLNIAFKKDILTAIYEFGNIDKIKNYRNLEGKIEIKVYFEHILTTQNESSFDIWLLKDSYIFFKIRTKDGKVKRAEKIFFIDGFFSNVDKKDKNYNLLRRYFKSDKANVLEGKKKLENLSKKIDTLSPISYNEISIGISKNDKNVLTVEKESELEFLEKFFIISEEKIKQIRKKIEEKMPIKLYNIDFEFQQNKFIPTSPFFTYYFLPNEIKESTKSGDILDEKGLNLDKILEKIKDKEPETFEIISNSLIGIVDELGGFNVDKTILGKNVLAFQEKGVDNPVYKEIVSDGTIHLIAILTALYEPVDKTLVSIEEPERHLHLKAISYLMDIFRNVSKEKQVLITTQSSEIMNLLDLDNDNIIFLFRDYDGNTKAISGKNISNLKKKMERFEYNLSDIIKNETLGYLGDYINESKFKNKEVLNAEKE